MGRELVSFRAPGFHLRIAPGKPERSALVQRVFELAPETHMPPLGAETVDRAGVEIISRWIRSMRDRSA